MRLNVTDGHPSVGNMTLFLNYNNGVHRTKVWKASRYATFENKPIKICKQCGQSVHIIAETNILLLLHGLKLPFQTLRPGCMSAVPRRSFMANECVAQHLVWDCSTSPCIGPSGMDQRAMADVSVYVTWPETRPRSSNDIISGPSHLSLGRRYAIAVSRRKVVWSPFQRGGTDRL